MDLYDRTEHLVKGSGRPSWGQLIAWTCSTQSPDVVQEVIELLTPVGETGLVPRGQNKRGAATTQINARFTPDEHTAFAQTRAAAQKALEAATGAGDVTATILVNAALTVAARSRATS